MNKVTEKKEASATICVAHGRSLHNLLWMIRKLPLIFFLQFSFSKESETFFGIFFFNLLV